MTAPALAGLALGDVVLLLVVRRVRRRRAARTGDPADALATFRAEHPVRRLVVGGVEWTYLVGGAGTETVLYLPGGTGHAEAAFTYVSDLERDHRVIAVDYPRLPSMAALADGVLAILDAEHVDTVAVWGTSFGGMAAQVLVRRAPDRVTSVVLSNTAAPDPRRAERAERQRRITARMPDAVVRWLLAVTVGRQLRGLDPERRRFWRSYLRTSLMADAKPAVLNLSRLSADFYRMAFGPTDLIGWPGRMLVLSARDDELYRSMREPLRRLYPYAAEVTFPGGHAATVSRDTEYVAAVRRFLARSRTSVASAGSGY